MCVLIGHANTPLLGLAWLPATTAVEVFFVISGFYMQMVLSEKYTHEKLGRRWWGIFYLARYFRLFPAYVAALALTIMAALVAYRLGKNTPPFSIWLALAALDPSVRNISLGLGTILANLTMFFQDLSLLLAIQGGQAVFTLDRNVTDFYVPSALAVPQAWSLSVELVFYLIAPVVLKLSRERIVTIFIIFILIKLGAVILISSDLPYRMFPFVLVHFIAGAIAYRFRNRLKFPAWISYVLMFSIVLIIPSIFQGALLSFVCLALTAVAIPTAFYATKSMQYDSYIGELSYPFYIFHFICLLIFTFLFKVLNVENGTVLLLITLGVTLGISIVVLTVETKYLEPWRQSLGRAKSRVV